MKLLLAAHSLASLAGAPLHTLDLCRGFRRAGHDVSAFTFYPGVATDILQKEGFQVFMPRDHRVLEDEPFDVVYLYHATCEVFLGLVFAGRTPIVRGYIGRGSSTANPVNAGFSSAVTYISEGVRKLMLGMEGWKSDVPSMIARNLYDDALVDHSVEVAKPPPKRPGFALVSNHVPPPLQDLLEKAAANGLCSFTHFGQPDNSVLVTPELLEPFDAVITVGRTVPLAAAMGKPVYLCDIHGIEGWLDRGEYKDSRRHSFSGRRSTIQDWNLVERQLLDANRWPGAAELAWVREQVERDHALSRRVAELESFFAEIIEDAPPPVTPPDGHRAVFRLLLDQDGAKAPGRRDRGLKLAERLKLAQERLGAAEERVSRQASQLRETQVQLVRCREQLRESDRKLREERATTRGLRQEVGSLRRPVRRALSRIAGYLRVRPRR